MARRHRFTWWRYGEDPPEPIKPPVIDWDRLDARLDQLALQYPITPEEKIRAKRWRQDKTNARTRELRAERRPSVVQSCAPCFKQQQPAPHPRRSLKSGAPT